VTVALVQGLPGLIQEAGFYVELGLNAAAKLVQIIKGIVGIRKDVGELRLKTEALKVDVRIPKELIEPFEKIAETRTEQGIEELSQTVVMESSSVDNGRRNELKIAVTRSVRFLAKKIDEGVRVEIEPPISQKDQQGKTQEEIEKLQGMLEKLNNDVAQIANIEHVASPVLRLPEPDETSLSRK